MQIFFNYNSASFGLSFIPYTLAKEIEYTSENLLQIQYRKYYGDDSEVFLISIIDAAGKGGKKIQRTYELPKIINCVRTSHNMSKEKLEDIQSMLKFMPDEDANFYKAILRL